nr:integrase, catalytic region, zinc finger, CCHC-type, peptidase aspartic, catalytic [Tanacetum cinerariifolium]
MHVANTFVEARCLALEVELATLRDKSHQEKQGELIKHFSKLEVDHLNLQLKYQNLNDSIGNNPPTPEKDTPDFDSVFVIGKMQASLQGKDNVIRQLKKQLFEFQVTSSDTEYVELIVPRLRNNRDAHLDYLRHLKESVEIIRDIVEEAKVLAYTPLIRKKQVTAPKPSDRQDSNKNKHVVTQKIQKTNVLVPHSTGVKRCPKASGSQPKSNHKTNRISPAKGANKLPIEDLPRTNKFHLRTTNRCSKHMTGDRSRLLNFVRKFIGTVRFGNDHFGAIMGYGNYVVGESIISRVYYVEGLGHNLFSVGQFCDSDLEVAFRKHSCYVRDTDGVDLIKGSHMSNLYTISVEDMMKSSPICLLSKASKNKSWLWHRRLNHLNFGTINDLARKDLVRGLPRLKFEKDHLCSACQLGKSKKHTHKPKAENTNLEVLNTLHIDLCGPMRVQTINGKKYILVIMDDYSWPCTQSGSCNSLCTPTNKELEILFQPMFDEFLEPPRAERPNSPAQAVQVSVTSAGTPLFTTIDQDAPSPYISPSSSALQSHSLPPGIVAEPYFMEDHNVAPVDNNPFVNVFALEPHSEASSSGDISSTESPYIS